MENIMLSIDNVKFGKRAAKSDPRTLKFENYVNLDVLPPAPPALDLSSKVATWPMFGNDRLGDCTIAAWAHMVQLWTAMSGKMCLPTEHLVEVFYYAIGRLETPGVPYPDNGLIELDVLKYVSNHWMSTEKAYAYTSVNPKNHDHIKQAVMMFGGAYIGFGIVNGSQTFDEFNRNVPWTPQPGNPTEGHAVCVVGYDANTVTTVSWGRTQKGTWAWFDAMVDEAWAVLPASWAPKGADPISGFDFATLNKDLAALK
jgi:hypothetical protein